MLLIYWRQDKEAIRAVADGFQAANACQLVKWAESNQLARKWDQITSVAFRNRFGSKEDCQNEWAKK